MCMARIAPLRKQYNHLTNRVALPRNSGKDVGTSCENVESTTAPPKFIFVIERQASLRISSFETCPSITSTSGDYDNDDEITIDSSFGAPFEVSKHCRWISDHSQRVSPSETSDYSPNKPIRRTDSSLNIDSPGPTADKRSIDSTPSIPHRVRSQDSTGSKESKLPMSMATLSYPLERVESVARSA